MVSGPLNGLKILDLTHIWAGPLAVRMLSDLGAEVVKVEAPYGRGPRELPSSPLGGWIGGAPGEDPWNNNAIFVKLARNRRSVSVDLKQAAGRDLFLGLVAQADVVMENFSVRAMPSLGLDFATLQAANPRIIYVTMPGFGISGPLKDRVAFGPTVEAMSGFTTVMGYGQDEPRNTAMALMDPVGATHAVAAVVTALQRREQTGRGSFVEMSLHEGGVAYNGPWLIDHQLGERITSIGNAHPVMSPHGVFSCAGEDAWLALACRDDADWQNLCSVVPGLDATSNLARRRADAPEIEKVINGWTVELDKFTATEFLQRAGVPAGPVSTTPDMAEDPQVQARGFFVPYERFATPMPGNPIKIDGLDPAEWTPCPGLGADNAEVLADWLGWSAEQTEAALAAGVLADKPPA
ncbi:MAG: CoA transferase [Pseudomonadota bacterium]